MTGEKKTSIYKWLSDNWGGFAFTFFFSGSQKTTGPVCGEMSADSLPPPRKNAVFSSAVQKSASRQSLPSGVTVFCSCVGVV